MLKSTAENWEKKKMQIHKPITKMVLLLSDLFVLFDFKQDFCICFISLFHSSTVIYFKLIYILILFRQKKTFWYSNQSVCFILIFFGFCMRSNSIDVFDPRRSNLNSIFLFTVSFSGIKIIKIKSVDLFAERM